MAGNRVIQSIFFEDCIDGMESRIDDGSIDLAFADPPFNIKFNSATYTYGVTVNEGIFYKDDMNPDEYVAWCGKWIEVVHRKLRENGIFILMISWNRVADLVKVAESIGFNQINHLIWNYEFAVYTSKKYATAHYHFPIFVKGDPEGRKWTFNMGRNAIEKYKTDVEKKLKIIEKKEERNERIRDIAGIIDDIMVNKRGAYVVDDFFDDVMRLSKRYAGIPHPCKLPEEVTMKLFGEWSNPGDAVLDVFAGSGTAMTSAFKTGRNYTGFEIGKRDVVTGEEIYGWGVLEMIKRRVLPSMNGSNSSLLSFA